VLDDKTDQSGLINRAFPLAQALLHFIHEPRARKAHCVTLHTQSGPNFERNAPGAFARKEPMRRKEASMKYAIVAGGARGLGLGIVARY